MSRPGWYRDPGGRPSTYRYWDGEAWSDRTAPGPPAPPRPRQARGVLVAVAVVLAVLLLGVAGVVRADRSPLDGGVPVGVTSPVDPCPVEPDAIDGPTDRPPDGRVRGGALSYPQLGDPWSDPRTDDRVAFGRDVHQQTVELERTTSTVWYTSVLVAELDTGAGFVAPQTGAQLMTRCLINHFYGDAKVDRDDLVNQSMRVDGHDAWRIESHLHFVVPGISVTSELMIVVVVAVGDGRAGLFYGSVPDTAPALMAPVRQTMAALRVG